MVPCGRPAVFMRLCKLHAIEYHALCHATVESRKNLLETEEPRRLHVLPSSLKKNLNASKPFEHPPSLGNFYATTLLLFIIGEPINSLFTVDTFFVVNLLGTHNIPRRTAAGTPIALCTYFLPTAY